MILQMCLFKIVHPYDRLFFLFGTVNCSCRETKSFVLFSTRVLLVCLWDLFLDRVVCHWFAAKARSESPCLLNLQAVLLATCPQLRLKSSSSKLLCNNNSSKSSKMVLSPIVIPMHPTTALAPRTEGQGVRHSPLMKHQ